MSRVFIRHRRAGLSVCALAFLISSALLAAGESRAQGKGCGDPAGVMAQAERLGADWSTAQLRAAAEKYHEARECWRSAGRAAEEAEALRRIGDIHFSLSDYERASESYEAALELRKAAGDRAAQAWALADLTTALAYRGQHERAAGLAEQALLLSGEAQDSLTRAHALNSAGLLQYLRGDLRRALAHFTDALALTRGTGVEEEAQALLHVGWVHHDANEIELARDSYDRSLSLWRALKHRRGEVKALTVLGLVYVVLGERQKAIECLDGQALPALREMGDRIGEAAAHNNLGYMLRTLGEADAALKHHLQALAIFKQIGLVFGQAVTAQYVGLSYEMIGRKEEAISYYEQALAFARALANPLIEADTLNSIGALKLSLGLNEIARDYFSRSLAAHEAAGAMRGQASALSNLGRYFDVAGDRRKALECFGRALDIHRAVGDRYEEAHTLSHIARVEFALGLLDPARAHVEAALTLSESLRAKVSGRDARASYFASVHRQFELYVDILMRQQAQSPAGRFEVAAFEASERRRARSLLEALAESRAGIRQGTDAALLARERELQRRLNAKTEQRIQAAARKAPAQELAALDEELSSLTAQYQQLQGQILASSPRYAALMYPTALNLAEIQRRVLDADTLLLEFALGEERSFAWAVTNESLKSIELPPRAVVERAARRVYELLTARNQHPPGETWQRTQERVERAEREYAETSAALAKMVLGRVPGELWRKRIVIVADGALQYVPFAALPSPPYDRSDDGNAAARSTPSGGGPAGRAGESGPRSEAAEPLVVTHEVVSLPSASVLAVMRAEFAERRHAQKSVAVLADPVFDARDARLKGAGGERPRRTLPAGVRRGATGGRVTADAPPDATQRALRNFDGFGEGVALARLPFSQREAEAIMAAAAPAGDAMVALGFRANRAAAMSGELAQYRFVHFATHGFLNSEHPELSGVVLSLFDEQGRRQDGFLQLHDIYNLNLPAELVVLSACQTALGKEVHGEGLVGLARGFMYAGAPRVVASLWKVDDAATARLMGEFYRAMLSRNLRPADALRQAQIQMWQQQRWRSPYYWAAFTLQGEWK